MGKNKKNKKNINYQESNNTAKNHAPVKEQSSNATANEEDMIEISYWDMSELSKKKPEMRGQARFIFVLYFLLSLVIESVFYGATYAFLEYVILGYVEWAFVIAFSIFFKGAEQMIYGRVKLKENNFKMLFGNQKYETPATPSPIWKFLLLMIGAIAILAIDRFGL